MKFSENSNNFHELVRLTRSMLYPARLDGSQCHNYIFRHCKRLVLRLILAHSIKSTLTRLKALKTSNARLKCIYHKIIYRFCLLVNVPHARMHSQATRDSSTAQQLFCASKLKRLHAYFFARLIKRYNTTLYVLARSVFAF